MKALKILILSTGLLFSNSIFALASIQAAAIKSTKLVGAFAQKAFIPALATSALVEWSKKSSTEPREYFRFYAPDEVMVLGEKMQSFNTLEAVTSGISTGAASLGCLGFLALPACFGLLTRTDISNGYYYMFGSLMTPVSFGIAGISAAVGGIVGAVAMPLATLAVRGFGSAL